MTGNNRWVYQGWQYHQWFGHGTAPAEKKGATSPAPGSLFDPFSVGKRIDYAVGSVVGQLSRGDRGRWEARLSGAGRDNLKTAVAVW